MLHENTHNIHLSYTIRFYNKLSINQSVLVRFSLDTYMINVSSEFQLIISAFTRNNYNLFASGVRFHYATQRFFIC